MAVPSWNRSRRCLKVLPSVPIAMMSPQPVAVVPSSLRGRVSVQTSSLYRIREAGRLGPPSFPGRADDPGWPGMMVLVYIPTDVIFPLPRQ